jgi:hypothetical protein
MFEINVMSK